MEPDSDDKLKVLTSRGFRALHLVLEEKTATLNRHETIIEELRHKIEEHNTTLAVLHALSEKSEGSGDLSLSKILVEIEKRDENRRKANIRIVIAFVTGLFGLGTSVVHFVLKFME